LTPNLDHQFSTIPQLNLKSLGQNVSSHYADEVTANQT
jgi:hypothetical protein